jgi:cell division topological specificity factor MinE
MKGLSLFSGLTGRLFGRRLDSKSKAKSRLHFVLVQDRTGLSAEDMSRFKRELVAVIESYFVIDKQGFDVSYERSGKSTTLLINSPVVVRRQDSPDHKAGATRRVRKIKKKVRPQGPQTAGPSGNDPGSGGAGPGPEPSVAV